MNDTLEQRAELIIGSILELPNADREAAAKRACGNNAQLLRRVMELLSADAQARGFMDATPYDPDNGVIVPLGRVGERPGDNIGRYKLLEKIGEGGFGVVFTAEQQKPVRRLVAVKVIKLGMDTREVVARFEAERQALALMEHPNIAKVLDAGSTDTGRPYFVMELVRGSPITDYADKHKLSTSERVALAAQVCRAVQHAHSKGVIHRDLKPTNVLVTVTDDKPVPKVIDFGIAKATHSRLTERTLFTAHRQLIGTPQYMSPEQADSDGSDIDTRTDVYSLGVLLYELLVGTTPIDAKDLHSAAYDAVRKMIRDTELPRPATRLQTLKADSQSAIATARSTDIKKLSESVKGELDWIVMKALEKDRTRRYETASALADDLDRYLSGEAVLAGPVSGTYRLKKALRRYKTAVAIGSAIAAILLLGVAGTAWGLLEARHQKAIADQKTEDAAATLHFFIDDILAKASPRETRDRKIGKVLVDALIMPALKKIDERFKDKPLVRASVQKALAETLLDLGRAELAEQQARASWDIRKQMLGEEHPDTLDVMEDCALAIKEQGRYTEAELMLKWNWNTSRRVRGNDDPETLTALSNYALAIDALDRHADAEKLDKQLWDARRRVQGDNHPDTLMAMNNYALAIDAQKNRHAEAEKLDKQLWDARRRVQGDDHPDTLIALDNYALAIDAQGRHAHAESLFRQALEASTRVQGEDHPDTLTALNNYATAIYAQGRYHEAEPLFKRFWYACRRLMGDDYPDTITALNNYVMVIEVQGHDAEAEPLFQQLWEARRRVLGDDNPDTLMARNNYVMAINLQGRHADAELMFKQLWETRKRVQGDDSPDTLMAWNNYALSINSQGRHAEAERLDKQLWEARRRVQGDGNRDTLNALNNYAETIYAQSRYGDAERLYKQLWESRRLAQGDDNAETLWALNDYTNTIDAEGRHADAEPLFKQLWDARRRVLKDDHPDTLMALNKYAMAIDAQGRHAEAESLLKQLLDARRRVLGGGTTLIRLRALNDYAMAIDAQGRHVMAESLLRDAVERFRPRSAESSMPRKRASAPGRVPCKSERVARRRDSCPRNLCMGPGAPGPRPKTRHRPPPACKLLNKCLKSQNKPEEPTTAPATRP